MIENIFAPKIKNGVIVISKGVTVSIEKFDQLFAGCQTIEDYIAKDAGVMGYSDFFEKVKAEQ